MVQIRDKYLVGKYVVIHTFSAKRRPYIYVCTINVFIYCWIRVIYFENNAYDYIMESETISEYLPNDTVFPFTLFSTVVIQYMKWIFSFKWYVIVLASMFLLFIILHIKESRKPKKTTENMQSILHPFSSKTPTSGVVMSEECAANCTSLMRNDHKIKPKKKVSFVESETQSVNLDQQIKNAYNWWILPKIYTLFRNIGFRKPDL